MTDHQTYAGILKETGLTRGQLDGVQHIVDDIIKDDFIYFGTITRLPEWQEDHIGWPGDDPSYRSYVYSVKHREEIIEDTNTFYELILGSAQQ